MENLKRIRDFGPLSELTELEGLTLEGSMWSTQRVTSLAPIGRLHKLKFLSIANLRADDGTLAPLFSLRSLETFNAAKWWNKMELDEIRRRNPMLIAEV